MSNVPLHYVDLRAFAYATEDERRVEEALRTFLPAEFEIDVQETEGHFGDRILVLSARVERADEVRTVLNRLADIDDVASLLNELDDRVTDNTELYLTLDKQAAYRGEVRRGDGITLRAKIEAYPATRERALESAESVLEELGDDGT